MSLEIILASIIFYLILGFLNRYRGGGPPHFGLPLRKMIWASLFLTPVTFLYAFMLDYTLVESIIIGLISGVGFALWMMNGWGSYFDMGRNETEYRDSKEDFLADFTCFKLFGPKWIPTTEPDPEKYIRYDVVKSPTGSVRPFKWRLYRDYVGMIVRGWWSLFLTIGLSSYVAYISSFNILWLLPVIFGPLLWATCYYIFNLEVFHKIPHFKMWLGETFHANLAAEYFAGFVVAFVIIMILI